MSKPENAKPDVANQQELESEIAVQGETQPTLEEQTRALEVECAQLRDQLLRSLAENQNQRKRHREQEAQIRKYATEQFVLRLLPVLDNFERTVQAIEAGATLDSVREGVLAVERQLLAALESVGVQKIQSIGDHFNPELHEALATEPSDTHEDGHVLDELQRGYKMADRVIRPASVKVSKRT